MALATLAELAERMAIVAPPRVATPRWEHGALRLIRTIGAGRLSYAAYKAPLQVKRTASQLTLTPADGSVVAHCLAYSVARI